MVTLLRRSADLHSQLELFGRPRHLVIHLGVWTDDGFVWRVFADLLPFALMSLTNPDCPARSNAVSDRLLAPPIFVVEKTANPWRKRSRSAPRLEEHRDRSAPSGTLAGDGSSAQKDLSWAAGRASCRAGCRHRLRLVVAHCPGGHSFNTDACEGIGQADRDGDCNGDCNGQTSADDHGHGTSRPHCRRSGSAGLRIRPLGVARTDPDRG